MKKTALHEIHKELNAKMIDFAGYMMPVQYEGVNIEHINVKNNVGVLMCHIWANSMCMEMKQKRSFNQF